MLGLAIKPVLSLKTEDDLIELRFIISLVLITSLFSSIIVLFPFCLTTKLSLKVSLTLLTITPLRENIIFYNTLLPKYFVTYTLLLT